MFSPSQLSRDKMVLWLLLTSDCSIIHPWIGYQVYLTYESDLPRSKRNLSLHLSAPSTLYDLRQKGFCFVSQTHPVVPSLIWSLCSSDRRFAARFLQISRHREPPCVKLTVTSVFTARDLHPIDYAHAGRTKKTENPIDSPFSIYGGWCWHSFCLSIFVHQSIPIYFVRRLPAPLSPDLHTYSPKGTLVLWCIFC